MPHGIKKKGGEIMKLLTKELEQRFAKIGSQESAKDPLDAVKRSYEALKKLGKV